MKVGDRVETPDGSHHDIIRITEDSGIQLSDCYFYCRSELKLVENKPTKTELIDKAIDDLGGDISNVNNGDVCNYNYLWKNRLGYWLAGEKSIVHNNNEYFYTIEEFEQRKKEREMEKNGDNNHWYDYDKERNTSLPPVDTVCEYTLSDGRTWYKCKVISHNNLVLDCPHLESMDNNGLQVLRADADTVKFRPLDWDKLSKRKHVVDTAANVLGSVMFITPQHAVEKLYDAGMLKLPEEDK